MDRFTRMLGHDGREPSAGSAGGLFRRRSRQRGLRPARRGTISVLAVVSYTFLIICLGMVLDFGRAVSRRQILSNACDAAAIGGAVELPGTTRATNAANRVLTAAAPNATRAVSVTATEVRAEARESVSTSFSRLFGLTSIPVMAVARAERKLPPVNEVTGGLTPWGVQAAIYAPGATVTLMLGGGSGSGGNFYALALGGEGASVYEENLKYGFPGTLGTGDQLGASTEPGAMVGPTRDGVQYLIQQAASNPAYAAETVLNFSNTNPRVLIVPMVQSWVDVSGKQMVQIQGFAAIYLIGMTGNNVTGAFVSVAIPNGRTVASRPDAVNYGVTSVKLVE